MRRCGSKVVGVDAGARRGEKGEMDREVGAGCVQGGSWGVVLESCKGVFETQLDFRIFPSLRKNKS
jgi:hypothetical protein